jgi:hypothetical protein
MMTVNDFDHGELPHLVMLLSVFRRIPGLFDHFGEDLGRGLTEEQARREFKRTVLRLPSASQRPGIPDP